MITYEHSFYSRPPALPPYRIISISCFVRRASNSKYSLSSGQRLRLLRTNHNRDIRMVIPPPCTPIRMPVQYCKPRLLAWNRFTIIDKTSCIICHSGSPSDITASVRWVSGHDNAILKRTAFHQLLRSPILFALLRENLIERVFHCFYHFLQLTGILICISFPAELQVTE